jgi:hypothetical protein
VSVPSLLQRRAVRRGHHRFRDRHHHVLGDCVVVCIPTSPPEWSHTPRQREPKPTNQKAAGKITVNSASTSEEIDCTRLRRVANETPRSD